MFILLWSKKNEEGWELEKTKEDLQAKIYKLMDKGCNPEDMIILPYRDDYITPEANGKIILR